MNKMQNISVIVITKNEERNILRCLISLQGLADEVVVLDSGSTDKTLQICKEMGAQVHNIEWQGYAKTKNLGHAKAQFSYILSIDADEELSPDLRKAITDLKSEGLNGAYSLDRHNFYLGKWIKRAGWHPDNKIRLFDKDKATWEGDFVHEELVLTNPEAVLRIDGPLNHYSIQSIDQHINTVKKYAQLAADRENSEKKPRSAIKSGLSTIYTFISIYLFKLGMLEGKRGFQIALYSSWSKWLRYRLRKN
jgi:glycosyltransferase involved in cell wall biosynthesis